MATHTFMEEPTITPELTILPKQAVTAKPASAGRLDWFGVLCSFGCAVHCAAMPVMVATLPSLTSLRWLADPLFHQVVAVLCAVLVARAIVPGYRKHRDSRVVTLAGIGIGLLFTAAFILPDTCCLEALQSEALQASSQVARPSQKMVLVSVVSRSGELTKIGFTSDEQSAGNAITCVDSDCAHGATFSRPLLTAFELEGQLGVTSARTLIQAQPYLSPIGGLFLIVAHIMNIRLRCCRRSPCGSVA